MIGCFHVKANLPERDCALPWEQRYGNRASRIESEDFDAWVSWRHKKKHGKTDMEGIIAKHDCKRGFSVVLHNSMDCAWKGSEVFTRMSSQKIMNVDFAGFRTEAGKVQLWIFERCQAQPVRGSSASLWLSPVFCSVMSSWINDVNLDSQPRNMPKIYKTSFALDFIDHFDCFHHFDLSQNSQHQDCGMRSVAIAYNPTSRDWNPLLDAWATEVSFRHRTPLAVT